MLKEDVAVAASLRGKPVPQGSTYGAEFIKAIYTKAAAEQRPMPVPDAGNHRDVGRVWCLCSPIC